MKIRTFRIVILLLPLLFTAGCGGGASSDGSPVGKPPSGQRGEVQLPPEAEGYGHLKLRLVYGGEAPAQDELSLTRDADYCGQHHPLDESLVVNQENGGIANIVAWLDVGEGEAPPPHAWYEADDAPPPRIDNQWCRFEPHVFLVRAGNEVIVGNKDDIGHNTKVDFLNNTSVNPSIPANSEIEIGPLEKVEPLPMPVSCSIHPWMNAKILVKDHPYMAVSDENGYLVLPYLPEGTWTIVLWQEKSGYLTGAKCESRGAKFKPRGRVEIEVSSGVTDLGEVLLPPAIFDK